MDHVCVIGFPFGPCGTRHHDTSREQGIGLRPSLAIESLRRVMASDFRREYMEFLDDPTRQPQVPSVSMIAHG
jgi:hypothetical protein